MRIIRRLLFKEVLAAVALVCAGFLLLFAFFDLVEELREVGNGGYSMGQALLYVLALAPGHLYDLLPIGLLIACVLVLSRLRSTPNSPSCAPAVWGPPACWARCCLLACFFRR